MRRTLEASAADIAESIGGVVVYRSDATYDLSAFLDSIKARHGKVLGLAAAAAQSWGSQQQVDAVEAQKQRRSQAIPELDAESWLVNKLVHNNDWANGSVADFRPVLESARNFLVLFRCANPDCGSWVAVTGGPGSEEAHMGQSRERKPQTVHLDQDRRTDPRLPQTTSPTNYRRRTLVACRC